MGSKFKIRRFNSFFLLNYELRSYPIRAVNLRRSLYFVRMVGNTV